MAEKKIIPWLDTVRVFSAFCVIVGHYTSCFDGYPRFDTMRLFFWYAGNIGVFLFFVLSGYLILPSLERSKSLWSFYKRKLIRVVIPFTVSYFVLGFVLMACGLVNPSVADFSPFYRGAYEGGFSLGKILAMFPVEVNFVRLAGLPLEWFVGEWFMGALLLIYLISPLLYKFIRVAPLPTFAATILLAVGTHYALFGLTATGRIYSDWWLFTARLPEFYFGMLLFVYKDFLLTNRRKILPVVTILTLVGAAGFILRYWGDLALVTRLYPLEPRSLLMTLPSSYLLFVLAERLNEKFPTALAHFNGFSGVSYMTMLTQHVILNVFASQFKFRDLHSVGVWLIFILVTLTIVKVSDWIKKFSDPLEKALRN